MTTETRRQPANIIDFLINEALLNERAGQAPFSSDQLVRNLLRQAPQRIYFSPDGKISRALLFRGEYAVQAFIQDAEFAGDHWVTGRAETLSCVDGQSLDIQLKRWARSHGRDRELLGNPDQVFRRGGDEFIHVGQDDGRAVISVSYQIAENNLYRVYGLIPDMVPQRDGEALQRLAGPPPELASHLNRFGG